MTESSRPPMFGGNFTPLRRAVTQVDTLVFGIRTYSMTTGDTIL